PSAAGCRFVNDAAVANGDDGFQIRSDGNVFDRVATTDNRDDGVDLWASAKRNVFVDARADDNGDEGMLIGGSRHRLRRPTANGNGTVGIDLSGVRNWLSAATAGGNGVYDLVHCAGDRVKQVTVGTTTRDCRRVTGAVRVP